MAKRTFHYHASAHALSGQFWRPFQRIIEVQAPSALPSIGGVGNSRVENSGSTIWCPARPATRT
jgi:hypothetical protein